MYTTNLKVIRPLIIWPPPRQIERAAWKFNVIVDLTLIAAGKVPSIRPATRKLITDAPIPQDTVLKRSHSDSSTHVVMPTDHKKRNWSYLKSASPSGEIWMSQQYIPLLQKYGEWRAFIVGGSLIHVVHTYRHGRGRWIGTQVAGYWSLEELRYVNLQILVCSNSGNTMDRDKINQGVLEPLDMVNPDEGTEIERKRARMEFEGFVLNTWRELVLMEKAEVGGPVSISVFCRLDIGLNYHDGQVTYFVNEVERSLTTSLWMSAMPDGYHGILADTFATTFYDWLHGMVDPMHI